MHTRHPSLELVATFAGEHQVRVRVDEARDDGGPPRVEYLIGVGRRVALTDPEHLLLVNDHRRVDEATEAALVTEGGVVGGELADVGDEAGGHQRSRMGTRSPVFSAVASALS